MRETEKIAKLALDSVRIWHFTTSVSGPMNSASPEYAPLGGGSGRKNRASKEAWTGPSRLLTIETFAEPLALINSTVIETA
jgi:hypothetical protein